MGSFRGRVIGQTNPTFVRQNRLISSSGGSSLLDGIAQLRSCSTNGPRGRYSAALRSATLTPLQIALTELTHFDESGNARMVDVGQKPETDRIAVASAVIHMKSDTLSMILGHQISKGDVLGIARIAGITGSKRTSDLIPLCHPLRIISVDIEFQPMSDCTIRVEAMVRAIDRTGVEMEALTAVTTAALTVYDMCKSVDRAMTITDVQLEKKSGGKSGSYQRD